MALHSLVSKMNRLERLKHDGMEAYIFRCPGCGTVHVIPVGYSREYEQKSSEAGRSVEIWHWNGSLEKPTFNPSFRVEWHRGKDPEPRICHMFITKGQVYFLNNSTHALRGQTVEMLDADD